MTHAKTIEVLRACLIIATIDSYITEEEYKAGLEYLEECNRFEEGCGKLIMDRFWEMCRADDR